MPKLPFPFVFHGAVPKARCIPRARDAPPPKKKTNDRILHSASMADFSVALGALVIRRPEPTEFGGNLCYTLRPLEFREWEHGCATWAAQILVCLFSIYTLSYLCVTVRMFLYVYYICRHYIIRNNIYTCIYIYICISVHIHVLTCTYTEVHAEYMCIHM